MDRPRVIQGGMGVGVSGWRLAREVSMLGELGVVSGTALDTMLIRRLSDGDPGGNLRRALAAFPLPQIAERALKKYFKAEGQTASSNTEGAARYPLAQLLRAKLSPERQGLMVLANFAEVYLAKEGHGGILGINYLEKIQMAVLPSLYGAMLAGVDYVLMGAGIPAEIPAVLDRFSRNEAASISLDVLEAGNDRFELSFDPMSLWAGHSTGPAPLTRPQFLPIVSSATLARALLKKAPHGIAGFVVEAPIAGGHNAPPRGAMQLTSRGEPIYGERDRVDIDQMQALGVPFWLAGGKASREKLAEALGQGASGIQVGTAFAFCEESGLDPQVKLCALNRVVHDGTEVFTDPVASPTGYPFKVVALSGTLSEPEVYADRERQCDLGYLRRAYRKADGTLGYRCPAEPIDDYVAKGGRTEDAMGRKCLCNSLVSNIGLGQQRADGYQEPAMLTAGDDIACIRRFLKPGHASYSARDVIESLL